MNKKVKVGFLIAGEKGHPLFSKIHEHCEAVFVSSYPQNGMSAELFTATQGICKQHQYHYIHKNFLTNELFEQADLIFIAGWQFLLPLHPKFIVFHDSLLPKYRGFSPTVTALINGEKKVGVTAFSPVEEIDAGPIYGQEQIEISYPAKIAQVYERLTDAYARLALSLVSNYPKLKAVPQDGSQATYCLWRDAEDYRIDWNWSADKIQRFIDAVGSPYAGAQTYYKNQRIRILQCEITSALHFEQNFPGKIWSLSNGIPTVVCGKGLIRVLEAKDEFGREVRFDSLRQRLGSHPTDDSTLGTLPAKITR